MADDKPEGGQSSEQAATPDAAIAVQAAAAAVATPPAEPDAPAAQPAPEKPSGSWKKHLIKWPSLLALAAAIIAIGYGFGGLTLARFDMIGKITGFFAFVTTFTPALWIAGISVVLLVASFILKTGPRWPAATALVLSGFWAVLFYTQVALPGGAAAPIHDITTDMDDTPQFVVLDRPETSTGPFTIEEWRSFHTDAYPDIAPIVIDKTPVEVLADARTLVENRGWEIIHVDADSGHLEATATAGYLRFYDDVIVEVTLIEDGSSRVDMRSVSQMGVSDLGYNAARIEAFLADLAAT